VHIGTYTLIDLEYNQNNKHLSIISAQPLEIEVTVKAFDISIEETDEVVEIKKFKSIFY
jgi:hypothetical protein